ncbi:MAG TPA: hypothetical protein VE465_09235 [Streptosporangiaceae bacterium]|nr:hypothetical protein [Streptosporangiaceae bacterium]
MVFGALIHLAAALEARGWPQTVLTPVRRRGGHPDEPHEALRVHWPAGEALVEANPDLVLHQMHDANQDGSWWPACRTSGSNGGGCPPPIASSCGTIWRPAERS